MKIELMPYQKDIVNMMPTPAGAMFVEAGKGKTYMSLAYFEKSDANKILVMCPNAKIEEWVRDIEEQFDMKALGLNKGTAKNKELLKEDVDALVITYENATRVKVELRKVLDDNWMMILDESHLIKNSTSKSSRTALLLSKRTPHKIILTATPQSKGWVDYFPQMKFLGAIDGSLTSFKNKYCILQHMEMGGRMFTKIIGYNQNIEEFKEIVHSHSVFYYPGSEADNNDVIIPVEKHISYDQMRKNRVYDRVRAGYSGVMHQYLKQLSSGVFNGKIVHRNKLNALEKVLSKHEDEDIVIFYYLDNELQSIIDLCDSIGRPHYQHNGSVKDAKEYMVSEDKQNAVILVQYQAGGTGLNWLVGARIAWFHSLPDRHLPFIQARKRLDRIGQERKCIFYIPITSGTLEKANYDTIVEGIDFDESRVNEALSQLD